MSTIDELREWEIKKLEHEILNADRPFYRKYQFWTATVPIAVAVIGITLQYQFSKNDYQLAEIKMENAKVQLEKVELSRILIDIEISQLKEDLLAMRAEENEVKASLEATGEMLAKLSAKSEEQQKEIDASKRMIEEQISKSAFRLDKVSAKSILNRNRFINGTKIKRANSVPSLNDWLSLPKLQRQSYIDNPSLDMKKDLKKKQDGD